MINLYHSIDLRYYADEKLRTQAKKEVYNNIMHILNKIKYAKKDKIRGYLKSKRAWEDIREQIDF